MADDTQPTRRPSSERRNEMLLWLLAGVAAVATGFGTRSYLQQRAEAARVAAEARFHPRPMVVARADLPPGSLLTRAHLAVRSMPADFLPASAVPAADAGQVLGRTLEHALRAGEPLQMPLLKRAVPMSLSQRIALGRRAVTIGVDDAAAAAGLLSPGDRVDLRWRGGGAPLENVAVLATGRDLGREDGARGEDFATITLELAESDARRLVEADLGDLRVVLRNPADTGGEFIARSAQIRAARSDPPVMLFVGGGGGPSPAIRLLQVTP